MRGFPPGNRGLLFIPARLWYNAATPTEGGIAVEIRPLSICEREAEEFYPRLPAERREKFTQAEFETFLQVYFMLSGDLESPDRAAPKGEQHGFLNSAGCVFFDDSDETGYVSYVAPGRGCEAYVRKCLARICPEMREMVK